MLQFSDPRFFGPTKKLSHPDADLFGHPGCVRTIEMPTGPTHHDVVEMQNPFHRAEILDCAPAEFGGKDAANSLCLRRRQKRLMGRTTKSNLAVPLMRLFQPLDYMMY